MRKPLALGLAASLAAAAPAARAANPEYPRDSCAHRVEDTVGDTSNTALDVTSVTLRLTDTDLIAFVRVVKITSLAFTETARRYEVTFTQGKRSYALQHSVYDPTLPEALRPPGSASPQTAGVDAATGYVWISVPRASIEADLGRRLVEDDTFESLAAHTYSYLATQESVADEASSGETTYVVGDDLCFGAPPAVLEELMVGPGQYGDPVPASVYVVDEDGNPLGGEPVTFYVGDAAVGSGRADGDGLVDTTLALGRPAGTYDVVARFAGDATTGKARARTTATVTVETTRFAPLAVARPSATTRTVTATLLDDDGTPVAGQRVDFWVAGRRVATVATNAAGRAVWKGAKPKQRVQARFLAVPGRYAAATSPTVTA